MFKTKSRTTATAAHDEVDIYIEFNAAKERSYTNPLIFREEFRNIF